MRSLVIDPSEQSLRERDLGRRLEDLQAAVGGDIEWAHEFENGDVLYVDEEGLGRAEMAFVGGTEAARAYFFDVGAHQKFAGKGLIVGAEGADGKHGPAASSVQDIAARLQFFAPMASVADGTPH